MIKKLHRWPFLKLKRGQGSKRKKGSRKNVGKRKRGKKGFGKQRKNELQLSLRDNGKFR
jgi:hypothetical protein